MKAVIYESNAGSSRRYAEMLASKLGVPAYPFKEALKAVAKDEEAIFIGWIFANKVQGLKKAQKRWNLVCIGAVGMNPPGEIYDKILHENNPTDIPLFYLRGALDYSKLKWLQKKLLQTICTDLEKQNKPGTQGMISVLKNGCDFVSEENLAAMVAYALANE